MNFVSRLYRHLTRDCWEIGFVEGGLDAIMSDDSVRINWLKHNNKGGWFADPFILDITDSEIIVLVEEYRYGTAKGRIAELVIDKQSYLLKEISVILELDTHLSFPAVYRKGNKIFIYPESWFSGALSIYEYQGRGQRLKFVKVICDEPMADGIITNHLGNKLLFSTKENDKLRIYDYNGNKFTYLKDVEFDEAIARNAGDFFEYYKDIYRPAQVCCRCYGEAVEIQKVTVDIFGNYSFEPVKRMYSAHPTLRTGMHTLNSYKGMSVIDVHGWVNPGIVSMIQTLKNCFCVGNGRKRNKSNY